MSDEEHAILFKKFEGVERRLRAVETRVAFGAGVIVAIQVLGLIVVKVLL